MPKPGRREFKKAKCCDSNLKSGRLVRDSHRFIIGKVHSQAA
jgi:hypothetical protein